VLSGQEQPQSTHADRYQHNNAYSVSSYVKGAIFLRQLNYIIGEKNFKRTLKRYYDLWAFKHPTPNDFIRCAEKASGIELDWYLTDWTKTNNTIDYGVKSINEEGGGTIIELERIGLIPMPVEIEITFKDGEKERYYIPLQMMRGEKPVEKDILILDDWAWAFPTYSFILGKKKKVTQVIIDPDQRTADINRNNNKFLKEVE
jgi:aminopeptidase N